MTFTYDLLEVDKPQFGGIVFPTSVVNLAIEASRTLELCRYEHWPESIDQGMPGDERNEMIAKLAESGRMLEVIGYVHDLRIVGGVLRAIGEMQHNLRWHLPLDQHTAIPYMDMHLEPSRSSLKVVKSFVFTEIVLVYQAVTKLALRKFAQRKSLLGVDRKA